MSLLKIKYTGSQKILVTADTVVYKNKIINKPKNKKDAFRILKFLSNDWHYVYTAVTVFLNNVEYSFVEKTAVKFMKLNSDDVKKYIEKEKVLDKAGGYAIQGFGGFLIESIKGDYFNVVGFPVNKFIKVLKEKYNINIV